MQLEIMTYIHKHCKSLIIYRLRDISKNGIAEIAIPGVPDCSKCNNKMFNIFNLFTGLEA